jgi:hypothetical protein
MQLAEEGLVAVALRKPLAAGVLDLQDSHGNTALHYAVRAGQTSSVEVLLDAGASAHIENAKGTICHVLSCSCLLPVR